MKITCRARVTDNVCQECLRKYCTARGASFSAIDSQYQPGAGSCCGDTKRRLNTVTVTCCSVAGSLLLLLPTAAQCGATVLFMRRCATTAPSGGTTCNNLTMRNNLFGSRVSAPDGLRNWRPSLLLSTVSIFRHHNLVLTPILAIAREQCFCGNTLKNASCTLAWLATDRSGAGSSS